MGDARYDTFLGQGPRQIAHWEHWSCPDAESYLSGIDLYEHPRQCRLKLRQLYPQLDLPVPQTDDPWPRPRLGHGPGQASSDPQKHTVRWGGGESWTWSHGAAFKTPEDVLAFSPLANADFRGWSVVEDHDYRDEEGLYRRWRANYPPQWGDQAPQGSSVSGSFYNTMFMWPLLTFGWELFMECCLDDRFERIMDEFAQINRRVFRTLARLPIRFVICHDDIVTSRGPVCSPAWMHKYIFPRYEEFWGMLKAAGKDVIFMADGCMDGCAADVMACGARGIISEPYTDYKALARRYKDCFLAGEGDNRVLMRNDPGQIRAMVESMVQTGRMSGGYMMCVGNHIPWNVPPEAIKLYLDLSAQLGKR